MGHFLCRLGRVHVHNIGEPVELYELGSARDLKWMSLRDQYERALAEFERGDFQQATQTLGRLIMDFPKDGPSLVLLSRSVDLLLSEPEDFEPTWILPTK